ncbi:hypothetical protein GJ496_008762 [Pomphorhynchus laevis]|nr:hypothetical protein GJ496_008762 [Pomphorhynchus laevis]
MNDKHPSAEFTSRPHAASNRLLTFRRPQIVSINVASLHQKILKPFQDIGCANPNIRQFQIRRFPAKRSDIPPWLSEITTYCFIREVYIMPELSPAELEIKNLLVNQLRERRIAEPNKSFCIRNNRVIQLSNSTSSNNCSVITLNKDKVTVVVVETTPVSDLNPEILGRNDRHPRNTDLAI